MTRKLIPQVCFILLCLAGCSRGTSTPVVAPALPGDPGAPAGVATAPVEPGGGGGGSTSPGWSGAVRLGQDLAELEAGGAATLPLLSARDLIVRIELPRLEAGVTWTEITLVAPDGMPFYVTRAAFSKETEITHVEVPGAAHPADVLHPTQLNDRLALDVTIPIGGTDLVRKARPGLWRVSARIESGQGLALTAMIQATTGT